MDKKEVNFFLFYGIIVLGSYFMYYTFRLKKGADLKKEITKYVKENNISGVILSGVGSLDKLSIRLADGESTLEKEEQYEIVSLNGTLSTDGIRLHIAVSDNDGKTIGGHLKDGCIINTTAEICLLDIPNIKFSREYDEDTGYNELVIKNKGGN